MSEKGASMAPHRSMASRVIVALVAIVGLVAVPVAAQAGSGKVAAAPPRGAHCVASLSPASATGVSAVTGFSCFGTFSDAVGFASKGAVTLARSAEVASADATIRRQLHAYRALASPLLGIEYNSTGFGGSSLTLTGSGGSGCYGGTEYSFGNLGSYGWNDKIGSARTYSNCVGQHFKNTGLSGTSTSVFGSKSDFGSLDNAISSIRFY